MSKVRGGPSTKKQQQEKEEKKEKNVPLHEFQPSCPIFNGK
jgi:hypothetical protein